MRYVLHSSGGDPWTMFNEVEDEMQFESSSDSDDEDLDADDPFSIPDLKIMILSMNQSYSEQSSQQSTLLRYIEQYRKLSHSIAHGHSPLSIL
jgi:hypothetical protein